jgi:hypothetical protein
VRFVIVAVVDEDVGECQRCRWEVRSDAVESRSSQFLWWALGLAENYSWQWLSQLRRLRWSHDVKSFQGKRPRPDLRHRQLWRVQAQNRLSGPRTMPPWHSHLSPRTFWLPLTYPEPRPLLSSNHSLRLSSIHWQPPLLVRSRNGTQSSSHARSLPVTGWRGGMFRTGRDQPQTNIGLL